MLVLNVLFSVVLLKQTYFTYILMHSQWQLCLSTGDVLGTLELLPFHFSDPRHGHVYGRPRPETHQGLFQGVAWHQYI